VENAIDTRCSALVLAGRTANEPGVVCLRHASQLH